MEIKDYSVPDDLDMNTDDYDALHPKAGYQHSAPRKQRWPSKKLLLIILAVVAVVIIAFAAVKLLGHKTTKTPTKQATTAANMPAPSTVTNTGTSQYMAPASGLNLSFTYPASWNVTPASGQDGKTITATSPLLSLPDASGTAVTGKVVVTIRGDTTNLSELANTTAKTPTDSVQYAYSAPTAVQHHYFYVSFLHFQTATSSTVGAFEEVAITGINTFPKGSEVTSDMLGEVDPLVTASFYKCTTQTCSGSGQQLLSITSSSWQNDPAMKQVQTLFESLKFN